MTIGTRRQKSRISGFILLIVAVCTFAVLIKNPDIAIGYVRQGLRLCAETVIPSLFPFMVLSGLFVELGVADLFSKFLSVPMRFLFGISGEGSAAPLMGALCGFPVGAATAHRLCESGRISRAEMSRLLAFSNNPSSAFLISAVGSALWSCPRFGIVLYVIQLLASLLIGVALRFIYPIEKNDGVKSEINHSMPGVRIFTRVVSESALSMLNVCALVLFFASMVGALISMLEGLGIGQTAKTLIYGFFEMSGAVGEAAKVLPRETGLILTALICGWSGLSVHFQVISICISDGVSFAPYFAAKGIQGIFSAFAMLFYIKFIDTTLPSICIPALAADLSEKGNTALAVMANAVLIIGLLICFFKRLFKCRPGSSSQGRADSKRP